MGEVRIAPTNDRSVVGVMNEFAFHGEWHWKDEGSRPRGALAPPVEPHHRALSQPAVRPTGVRGVLGIAAQGDRLPRTTLR